MGMSSQRILLIVVVLNLMIGLACSAYYQQTYSSNIYDESTEYSQERLDFMSDEFGEEKPDSENILAESGFGDQRGAGRVIWDLFKYGLKPIPAPSNPNNIFEVIITDAINYFRVGMGILLAIEIYFVFFNKKHT